MSVEDQLNPRLERNITTIQEIANLNEEPVFSENLETLFNNKYEGGKVEYDSLFEFQPLVSDSSIDTLSFEFSIREITENGETGWNLVEFEDWINADNSKGKLSGTPKKESVFKSFSVKVKVSDGYKVVEEEFHLTVTPTLGFILEILFQFGSVIAVTFGTWKYKDEIHSIVFKNKFIYDQIKKAKVGNLFRIDIPIIRLELEDENPVIAHIKAMSKQRQKKGVIWQKLRTEEWIGSYF